MHSHDIITVVRDPRHPLGKQFSLDSDGTIHKKPAVAVTIAEAVQHHVPDVDSFAKLLREVSEDSHAAIINSAFPLVHVGQPFLILSANEFAKRGFDRADKSITWPVMLDYGVERLPALGRFKEHTAPSSWLLLDRDVDENTPEHYAKHDYEEWLTGLDKLLPGVLACARLRAYSSSARVSYQGSPVGGGNGHTWIQVVNPADIDRMRTVVKARALVLGMTWLKPRRSRTTDEVVGHGIASIVDWSVFTTGRLVFAGKPEVNHAI